MWQRTARSGLKNLTARDRPYDHECFPTLRHLGGQRGVQRLVRKIFLACKETQERPPLPRSLIADGAAQHRVLGFECVQNGASSYRLRDCDFDLGAGASEILEMVGEFYSNHCF